MTSESSEIADFYPRSFTIDMNGKRWPWEAVVLLPFIDSRRLLNAVASVDCSVLTTGEKERNEFGEAVVYEYDERTCYKLEGVGDGKAFGKLLECNVKATNFNESALVYTEPNNPVLSPRLTDGVLYPLPSFPTLRDGNVIGLWRKLLRINVHGSKSRYKTACLEIQNPIPEILSLEELSKRLIGSIVYIDYPHFLQAFVTAVSNSEGYYRGKAGKMTSWNEEESAKRNRRVSKIVTNYVFGEKLVGTGGLTLVDGEEVMDSLDVLLYVRPFVGLRTLSNGVVGRLFAKFEVEVPLFVTGWAPKQKDERFSSYPVLLEKDPYNSAKFISTEKQSAPPKRKPTTVRKFIPLQNSQQSFSKVRAFHSFARTGRSESYGGMESSVTWAPEPIGQLYPLQRRAIPMLHKSYSPRIRHRTTMGILTIGALLFSSIVASVSGTYSGSPFTPPHMTPPLEFSHGTTTLSFVFQEGIIAAVDSRASIGNFVGSKTTEKVLPINSHLLGTMAGGAADCMYWIGFLRKEAELHELAHGCRMSVAYASRLLAEILYRNRNAELSIGTMIMGFDDNSKDPAIYYVDNSGARIKGHLFAVGSGASHALGVIDKEWRYDMTVDEAIKMGIKAIRFATYRDSSSGGFINVYLITKNGWHRVYRGDVAAIDNFPSEGSP